MNVGVVTATRLKEKSVESNIPFADLLKGFAIDELMILISESSFKDCLWLAGEDLIGQENYLSKAEKRIDLYYIESEKTILKEKLIPGQILSQALVEVLCKEICQSSTQIAWSYECKEDTGYVEVFLQANYCEMHVPLLVRFLAIRGGKLRANSISYTPVMGNQAISLWVYAPQNRLAESFFEIMSKLELISDMSFYDTVNEILKVEPVSGRLLMEELIKLSQKDTKVLRLKRMEQMEGYMHYKYMEKRWEQYRKKTNRSDSWQEVLGRFLSFGRPIWTALCQNEIFFEDWMPELGRYLD